ncbi:MAG: HDOD domain-containing protein [Fimbriimonadaceae bacterium]|nr:HDOD domain-containing protein [Fimbriimonadaceae bacterium]
MTEVLNTIDDPSSSPRMLEGILERDASIAGKILRVSNSAAYSSQPIASVGRAVTMLGLNTVRSLVVSIGFQNFSSGRSRSQRFSKVEFWKHSLAVALAARVLARMKAPALAEEAYTAGLMHDMGLMIVDRFCPAELDRAIIGAQEQGKPLCDILEQVVGFHEAQVSGLMAERFRLGERIRHAIQFHLNPIADDKHQEASMLVSAANTLAHQCGYENQAPGVEMVMDPMAQAFLGMPDEQLAVIRTVVQAEVAKNEAAFNLDSAA